MPDNRLEALYREADHLHYCLFSRPISKKTREWYVRAHEFVISNNFEEGRSRTVTRVVENRLDAEAVEFALRNPLNPHPLSKKLQVLVYLTEIQREYYADFVNETQSTFRALIALFTCTCRSVYKRIKGVLLVWGFRLV